MKINKSKKIKIIFTDKVIGNLGLYTGDLVKRVEKRF